MNRRKFLTGLAAAVATGSLFSEESFSQTPQELQALSDAHSLLYGLYHSGMLPVKNPKDRIIIHGLADWNGLEALRRQQQAVVAAISSEQQRNSRQNQGVTVNNYYFNYGNIPPKGRPVFLGCFVCSGFVDRDRDGKIDVFKNPSDIVRANQGVYRTNENLVLGMINAYPNSVGVPYMFLLKDKEGKVISRYESKFEVPDSLVSYSVKIPEILEKIGAGNYSAEFYVKGQLQSKRAFSLER